MAILCASTKKLLFYKLNGNFISETKLHVKAHLNALTIVNNKTYVEVFPTPKLKDDYLLYEINTNGNITDKIISNTKYRNGFLRYYTYKSSIFEGENYSVYYKPFMNTVFKIDGEKVIPELFINIKDSFSKTEISKINKLDGKKFSELTRDRSTKKFLGISKYLESGNMAFLEVNCPLKVYRVLYDIDLDMSLVFYCLTDDVTNIPMFTFSGAYKNKFVRLLHGKELELLINGIKKRNYGKDNPALNDVDMNSNPVLILYKLKAKTELFNR